MDYAATDPEALATAIVADLGRPVDHLDVDTDGAFRTPALIAELT